MENVFDELKWRGLVAQTTDEHSLREAFNSPLTSYCGFDPTAASLHVGHLLQIIMLRKLQKAGHHVLCLVGGATGMIGDPRPTAERTLKTKELTAEYVESIKTQISPFLDFSGSNPVTMVNNLDWFGDMTAIDFLRDLGKHFRVNQMLKKDSVSVRMTSEQGISFTEFSYQILQGYDYLYLHRKYGCSLQTGALDQWGNIAVGADLIRRLDGDIVHGLTTPLITTANGEKFGKSEGNAIWLDSTLCSPYKFYQFWLNSDDSVIGNYLRVFTEISREEIEDLEDSTIREPHKRRAQVALAKYMTQFVHGDSELQTALAVSAAVFGTADPRGLSPAAVSQMADTLPSAKLDTTGYDLAPNLVKVGLAKSNNEARRLIGDNAITVNGIGVKDPYAKLEMRDQLEGIGWLVRRGRKTLGFIRS